MFQFIRYHIPTKTRETGTWGDAWETRLKFLETLAAWNAQQPGTWQYWEASYTGYEGDRQKGKTVQGGREQ